MKINKIFFAALFGLVALSCGTGPKDIVTPDVPGTGGSGNGADGDYSFVISAGRDADAPSTRATMDELAGTYLWNAGDQVGFIAVNTGNSAVVFNKPLTAIEGGEAHTVFKGKLSAEDVAAFDPSPATYDYYSYYPYGLNVNVNPGTRVMTFAFPTTVEPGVFDPMHAPMIATATNHKGEKPLVFVDGDYNVHDVDSRVPHFDYKHVFSYVAIEMDVALMPDKVDKITISTESSDTPMPITGTMNISLDSNGIPACSWVPGTERTSVEITIDGDGAGDDGGLEVGVDGKSIIYLPMPVGDMSGQTFSFEFITDGESGAVYKSRTGVQGKNFERGKIHHLKLSSPSATYTVTTTFNVTKTGYYYVEVWGGDGGNGKNSDTSGKVSFGGSGGNKRDLYKFDAGNQIEVVVGMKGGDGGARAANGLGGSSSIGRGGNGGVGGAGYDGQTAKDAYSGAGGGGASGIKVNSAVWLVAGGGGGGGGLPSSSLNNTLIGGISYSGLDPMPGDPATDLPGKNSPPNPGDAQQTTNSSTGATGMNGDGGGWSPQFGGGGSGGGGGGWTLGGYSGPRGQNGGAMSTNTVKRNMRGGGGGGGQNYVDGTKSVAKPAYITLPTDNISKPTGNGYVVITFFRP